MRFILRAEAIHCLFIPGERRRGDPFAKGEFLHHLDFALQLQAIPLLTIALTRWLALMAERNIGKPGAGFTASDKARDGWRQGGDIAVFGGIDPHAIEAIGGF